MLHKIERHSIKINNLVMNCNWHEFKCIILSLPCKKSSKLINFKLEIYLCLKQTI